VGLSKMAAFNLSSVVCRSFWSLNTCFKTVFRNVLVNALSIVTATMFSGACQSWSCSLNHQESEINNSGAIKEVVRTVCIRALNLAEVHFLQGPDLRIFK
jgi:hypothetical protein